MKNPTNAGFCSSLPNLSSNVDHCSPFLNLSPETRRSVKIEFGLYPLIEVLPSSQKCIEIQSICHKRLNDGRTYFPKRVCFLKEPPFRSLFVKAKHWNKHFCHKKNECIGKSTYLLNSVQLVPIITTNAASRHYG